MVAAGLNWLLVSDRREHVASMVAHACQSLSGPPQLFVRVAEADGSFDELRAGLAGVRSEVERLLQVLKRDVLELVFLNVSYHRRVVGGVVEKAWETLETLRQEGKIRHLGIAGGDHTYVERLAAIASVTALLAASANDFRYFKDTVFPVCEAQGVGVLMNPARMLMSAADAAAARGGRDFGR